MAKENRGLKPSKKVIRWNRSFVVLTALLVLVLGIVGTTLAWLTDKTTNLTNTFEYAKVSCQVWETFNDTHTTKNEVRIQNTGNTDAYIRVTYVVTIRDDNGNILYDAYETETFQEYMTRLESRINDDGSWQKGKDGYWYYRLPVAPNEKTEKLFGTQISSLYIEINGKKAETHIEILASAVQAMPTNAVEDAWTGATVQTVTVGDSTINLLTAPGASSEIPGN